MRANDKNSYLSYLNKLVDQYNNTHHNSIGKKPVDGDYSAFTEEIETESKFKVGDRVKITKYKNIFNKGYSENWPREILFIDSVLKVILRLIKYLNI